MDKEFVPHQQSLDLEELGFYEECLGYHLCKNSALGVYLEITTEWIDLLPYDSSSCKAPTFSQAFRWFREKYDLDSYIMPARLETKKVYDYYIWFTNEKEERDLFIGMNNQYTYEEAELACLEKLIEIVKEKE